MSPHQPHMLLPLTSKRLQNPTSWQKTVGIECKSGVYTPVGHNWKNRDWSNSGVLLLPTSSASFPICCRFFCNLKIRFQHPLFEELSNMENRSYSVPKKAVKSPFTLFLWEKEKFERRVSILEAFTSNPIFSKGLVTYPSMARKDVWTRTAQQSRELIRLSLTLGWSRTQFMEAIRMTDNFLPVQPQFRIFMSNLERQMSDEQKAIWVPKAENFEIFGSYAQTELGHGSNVQGIETTAMFDEETDEFVINSPNISSTKYWIGATGMLNIQKSSHCNPLTIVHRCMGNSLYCCC
jgi:hypothetical protein